MGEGGNPRVYPRPRGGTAFPMDVADHSPGLSPPTRGNPTIVLKVDLDLGSIPAHAGEPRLTPLYRRAGRVYPRPRGGTSPALVLLAAGHGLSPAHAGEPQRPLGTLLKTTVYPRPRGGTYFLGTNQGPN